MVRVAYKLSSAAAALGLCLLTSPALAQSTTGGAEFGKRDEFVLSIERIAGFTHQEFGDASIEGLGIHPFLWGTVGLHSVQSSGLTLGALLGATYLRIPATDPNDEDQSASFLQLRPRIGYGGWLERSLGYWVRIGPSVVLILDHDQGDSHYSFGVGGEAYAVIRAADHVAFLAGIHFDPAITADEDGSELGSYGLTVGLMGEFF